MANFWRRRKGTATWHFCSNCSNWPRMDYDASVSKPSSGEFCDECQSKQQLGNCT